MAAPAPGGGVLLVVATPLGNLGDIGERARKALAEADVVACEDTRVTGNLLRLLGIAPRSLVAYHEHNEVAAAEGLADLVASGKVVALVTDAGTPALSDPGFRATRACARRGLRVSPVPGPCSPIALLSASGLPTNAFRFVGFLPPKSAARRRFLETEALAAGETVVLLESCVGVIVQKRTSHHHHRTQILLTIHQQDIRLINPPRGLCPHKPHHRACW